MSREVTLTTERKNEIGFLILIDILAREGIRLDKKGIRKLVRAVEGTMVNQEEVRAFIKEVVEELLLKMSK